MNKKLMIGALALSASAVMGLTGCGGNSDTADTTKPTPPETPPTKYTVTFDHDNNPATQNQTVEFTKGDTNLNQTDIPAVPADSATGFAGVWDSFTLSDTDITVTAKYGNGTATNPYLVATADQFASILRKYASIHTTKYYIDTTETNSEAEATKKVEQYENVKVTYTKNAKGKWAISSTEKTSETHFKLIADINVSDFSTITNGKFFAGSIDGNNHTLTMSGNQFVDSEGALFANACGATIKNLNVKLGTNIAPLFNVVRSGENVIENVTVFNSGNHTFINADDNNEGVFVANVIGNDTKLTIKNSANNAKLVSTAKYFGIFVGGYATANTTVEFINCINNGDVITSGVAGVFFGNNSHKPKSLTITNCAHNGTITYNQENANNHVSHILCADVKGSGFTADACDDYDAGVSGQVTLGANAEFKALTSKYIATIDGTDITVSNPTAGANLEKGKYELTISALASNGKATVRTNLTFTVDATGTTSNALLDNVLYGFMDVETYKAQKDIDELPAGIQWNNVTGYTGIRYFLDADLGYYVFDFSVFQVNSGYGDAYKINVTADKLDKAIVATSKDGQTDNIIDFVVNFTTND